MTANSDSRLEQEVNFRDDRLDNEPIVNVAVDEDSGQGHIRVRDRQGQFVHSRVNDWMLASREESGQINQEFKIESKSGENDTDMTANRNTQRESQWINNTYLAIAQATFLILGLGAIGAALLVQNTTISLVATFAVPILFALAFLGIVAERSIQNPEV